MPDVGAMFKVGLRDVVVNMKLAARDQVIVLVLALVGDPCKTLWPKQERQQPSYALSLLNLFKWC